MKLFRFMRRRRADAELEQEIDFYLAEEVAENLAQGKSPEEARRQARIKLGNSQRIRESLWQQNSVALFDGLRLDLKYAARTLARSPGFTVIAILVMALGIGTNVAIFTVVRSVLLKPLPFRDPERLATLYQKQTELGPFGPSDGGSFALWQQAARGAAEMAIVNTWQVYNVSAEGGQLPEKIDAAWCSGNFLSMLGVTPALGRTFTEADDRPGAEATVVLSNSFWKRRYSNDPKIVGGKIWLDARPYTVIGVLPASFEYQGPFVVGKTQLWTAVGHEAPPPVLHSFDEHAFVVVARLIPGATLGGLLGQLNGVQRQVKRDHPGTLVSDAVTGWSLLNDEVYQFKQPLYAIFGATACVLLIACLNVASLLVARTAARRKDVAVRCAVGGGRLRLARERLMESLLLSAAGGALGMSLAWEVVSWLVHARQDINRVEAIQIDGTVVAFALGAVAVCAIFSGLISALSVDSRRILGSLQESSRGHSGGPARAGMRRALLALEVSLTVVLLVGAGLLLKSYERLRTTDLGVPTDNVLTMRLSLPEARYGDPARRVSFFERLIGQVRTLPGVQAAGLVNAVPGQDWGGDHLVSVVEHPPLPHGEGVLLLARGADPGYFSAIRIPLLRGRTFAQNERLQRANVTLISQAATKQLFPGEDPIGKHLKDSLTNQDWEVVGIVGDTRFAVRQAMRPTMYVPIFGNDYAYGTIVVRSTRDVESLATPVEKVIDELDRDLPVSNVMTLRDTIERSTLNSQFDSLLVVAFAAIALALAAAGLYGVLVYLVTQRTNEIGVRIALGAQRQQLLRLVLLDGMKPALMGLGVGLAASVGVARLIRSMLYGTQPFDPAIFAGASLLLLVVAASACLVPAWHASRLDPIQALRAE